MKQAYVLFLFIFSLFAHTAALAGGHRGCRTTEFNKTISTPYGESQRAALSAAYANWVGNNYGGNTRAKSSNGTRWIIPIVVHILHSPSDPLPGDSSNITDAQVLKAIAVLNEDYRKVPGTKGGNGPGKDMQIEFRMATIDPEGRCTNGIIRKPWAGSENHDQGFKPAVRALKALSHWPRTKYLNLYVIHSLVDDSDYAYTTWPWHTNTPYYDSIDGSVIVYKAFGPGGLPPVNLGKTLTHEVGHWLGLLHPFENELAPSCINANCLLDNDQVCDTPPVDAYTDPNFICNDTLDDCTADEDDLNVRNPFRPVAMGGLGNQPNMIQNYMDYSKDSCMDRFTPGQYDRVYYYITTTRASVVSDTNAVSTGIKMMQIDFDSLGTTIGLNGIVTAMVEWKEKDLLIIAGNFTNAAGMTVPGIVSWNGVKFDSLAGAPAFYGITSLSVYGGSLYVGGQFTLPAYKYLVRYNGSTWSKVTGSTITDISSTGGPVRVMRVYGGKLYVGGDFGVVNGGFLPANRIAAWNGSAWSTLGSGSTNGLSGNSAACYAMTNWSDQLIVAGRFTSATGILCHNVAAWTGSAFRSLNSGTSAVSGGSANSLGSIGGKLFIGGDFNGAGGIVAQGLLVFDSTTWKKARDVGFDRRAMEVFNGMLWVGGAINILGTYVSNIYAYDHVKDTFYTVASDCDGFDNPVNVMTVYKDELYVAGELNTLRGINGAPNKPFGYITKARTYCVDKPTGVPTTNGNKSLDITIYPNPATDEVFIKNGSGAFNVYNAVGILCGSGNINQKGIYRHNVGAYPPGIYYFRFLHYVVKVTKL